MDWDKKERDLSNDRLRAFACLAASFTAQASGNPAYTALLKLAR